MMIKALLCFVLVEVAISAPMVKDCAMMMCIDLYQPVCGSDQQTYSNDCYLSSANACSVTPITKVSDGMCYPTVHIKPVCQDMMCMAVYDPVCGSDSKTYSSSCQLENAKCRHPGLTLATHGACDNLMVS